MSEKIPNFSKERAFHKKRWEKKAEADASSSIFSRAINGEKLIRNNGDKKDWQDFMHKEALRDNAEYDKKYLEKSREEYEAWDALLEPVIEGFKRRVENPDDANNGTLIIMWPGGMQGSYLAGQSIGLHNMGVKDKVVDMIIGTSTGAVVATPFVEGTDALLKSTTMMEEELADKDFINVGRWWQGNVIRLQKIKELWSRGEYKIDEDAIRKAHTELLYTVTEPLRGDGEPVVRYLDAKTIKPGMIDGVIASMTIPFLTGKKPKIDGETYYDGGFGLKDIEKDIAEFTKRKGYPPKNVLILPTTPFETLDEIKPTETERRLAGYARRRAEMMVKAGSSARAGSLRQIEKGLLLKGELRKSLELIKQQQGINVGVWWPPRADVSFIGIDSDNMTESVISSGRDIYERWGVKQPEEFPHYVSHKTRLADAISKHKKAA